MSRLRTKGTGSLTLRGNVYWIEYQAEGKRLRESANTSDRTTAENYLRQRIGEVAAGHEIVPGKATIADLCRLVMADYKLRQLRSLQGIKWGFEANIDRLVGNLPAGRFGAHQIRAYVEAERTEGIYSTDSGSVAHQVREWAIEWGNDPRMRIALCGYEGEHVLPESWECLEWKARGGYGSQGAGLGRANSGRERIWFSPHCLKSPSLWNLDTAPWDEPGPQHSDEFGKLQGWRDSLVEEAFENTPQDTPQ